MRATATCKLLTIAFALSRLVCLVMVGRKKLVIPATVVLGVPSFVAVSVAENLVPESAIILVLKLFGLIGQTPTPLNSRLRIALELLLGGS